jgi:Zn-dependent peptidase ImmA (M78 family)
MSEAYIQSEVLNWAIKRSNIPLEKIAQKNSVNTDRLIAWTKGNAFPTFNQAMDLANSLHIPFGYLFLSTIPDETIIIPDLRRISNSQPGKFSPDFIDVINSVQLKQEWFRDFLLEENEEPLSFIGKFSLSTDPQIVSDDISKTLGINQKLRNTSTSWEDFLTKIIRLTEKSGILVFRSGIVGNNTTRTLSVDEFRGFAICDEIAPLIFLNSQDYKVAQIFTLAHEIAHLWIGKSGISNIRLNDHKPQENLKIEYFCNEIAAELLVPKNELSIIYNPNVSISVNLSNLVRKFRVSRIVVLRRLFDIGFITEKDFFLFYDNEIKNFIDNKKKTKEKTKSKGDFYVNLFSRNSNLLTSNLISATLEGKVSYRHASSLLNINENNISKIAKKLGYL